MPNSLKSRLKGLVRKGLLSEKDLSRIYTDNDVVAELEKIKEEIQEEMEDYLMEVDYIRGVKDGLLFSAEIVDRHIKENKEK